MSVVIPVTKGTLSEHGYSVDLPVKKRRDAIVKAIESEAKKRDKPALSIYRHLIARATQHKQHKHIAKVLRADADWVKATYYGTKYWPAKKRDIEIAVKEKEGHDVGMVLVHKKNDVEIEGWRRKVEDIKPIDFEFDAPVIVRVVPAHNLVEVAIGMPEDYWVEVVKLTHKWGAERPPERVIFRHSGVKQGLYNVNVFLDNMG